MSQRKTKLTSATVALIMATSPSIVISEEVTYLVGRSLGIQEKYVKVKIKDNKILKIQNISKRNANSSPYKIVDSNGKLGFFYPSDYEYQINRPEKKNIAKYRKLRRKFWKSYAGVAANSLLFNEDKDLEKLDRLKRQREIAKREKRWKKVAKMYLDGDYIGVIEEAPKLFPFPSHQAAAHFLSGLSHKKMQDYKSAVKDLEKAKKYKFKNNQLYYELAQSHFALNQLEKAYEEFKISVDKNFQPFQSKYYMGWIHENLGNNKQAIAEYNELLKMKNLPTEMAQAVHIRLVKLHEKNLDKSLFTFSKSSYVQKFIISPGKKGVDLDPKSNNASTLERLMERIRNKYQTPSILSFKIGSIGNSYRFNQNFTYDTNVTAQAESASDFRDSGYSNSQFLYKHFFGSKKGFTHNPELRFDYRHHFERNVSAIISNDNYIISPSFRNSFEHKWLGYKTRATFDIESSYTVQDINGTNEKSYFSKSVKFNFGNNFKFTKLGDTIIKYRYDIRQFKDSTLDTRTNTLFINQLLTLPNDKIVSVIANADFASVTNTPSNNTNTFMLRADYIQKQAFWKGDLQAAFTLLLTDTLENSATRGIEKNYGPEIEFRKGVFKNLEVALQYNYNKNTSDLDANNYDQHVISLEFELSK